MTDEEEIILTEESEDKSKNNIQIYNIKNSRNQQNQNIKESSEQKENNESSDIMSKINKEAKNLNSNLNTNNLKVFEKYHNLSKKELKVLISQKNQDLIRLNKDKEKSKKVLADLIYKLNNIKSSNSDYLFEDFDTDLISNLVKIRDDKKRQLENSKKLKNLFKDQLEGIKEKIANNENEKKKLGLIDNKIDDLKKKNILLKNEIKEIKNKKTIQDKEVERIIENKKYFLKIKTKTDEMNNFTSQKHDYFDKLNMSLKSLDNIIKEIKRFDEIYNSSIKENTDEHVIKKINFWINLIKNDLEGDNNEIVNKIQNNKSQFLKEIKKRNKINIINNNITLDSIESIHKIKNAHTEGSTRKLWDYEKQYKLIKKIDINTKGTYNIKSGTIIDRNKSSNILFSNFNNNIKIMKRYRLPLYVNSFNSASNLEKGTLFRKINYLKLNNSSSPKMKYKLKNINKLENNSKVNNYFISEEINDPNKNNKNDENKNDDNINKNINDKDDIENNEEKNDDKKNDEKDEDKKDENNNNKKSNENDAKKNNENNKNENENKNKNNNEENNNKNKEIDKKTNKTKKKKKDKDNKNKDDKNKENKDKDNKNKEGKNKEDKNKDDGENINDKNLDDNCQNDEEKHNENDSQNNDKKNKENKNNDNDNKDDKGNEIKNNEHIDDLKNNTNTLQSIPDKNLNNENLDTLEFNPILFDDYNIISDADYRELLSKKEQYLESNIRLEKNISEIKRTKNNKLLSTLKLIKENQNELDNIKQQNKLIENEIINLTNILQLTMQQAKLQTEIKKNLLNKKKFKIKPEQFLSEENNLNNQKEKNLAENTDKNKENNIDDDDLNLKKRKIKNREESSKKKKKKESREEKLREIKEKYKDGNEEINEENKDSNNEEINNNNEQNKKELSIINENKENSNVYMEGN